MTPSSEEKEIRSLLQSFPTLRLHDDKYQEISSHLRREKERLARLRRSRSHRILIGGLAAAFAFMLVAYQLVPGSPPFFIPSAHNMNYEEGPNVNAAGTSEKDAVSTIDRNIQAYVEAALNKTEAAYHPQNMTVIISDPHTGEILGMANRSQQQAGDNPAYAVRAMPDPIAAFQIVTLAAAIQEGKFDPREIYQSGTYEITEEQPVKDYNNGVGWGQITFEEGVLRSSNVLFAILGSERLKRDLLHDYYERFGFGQKTGIELSDEEAGKIPAMDNPREVAAAAIGLGGFASAIQQIAAVSAIANGGELIKPHLIKTPGSDATHNDRVRRVVSEATAKQVRELLESVVSKAPGTGKAYHMEKYPVAGKTAVYPKYDQQGKAVAGKYVASFIGFAPSDNPKLLVYVTVDEPQTDLPAVFGWGPIMGPLFKEVMGNSLEYLSQR